MKKNFLLLTLIFGLCMTSGFAQIVDDDAYLQGDFVELGISACGTYISSVSPPEGYHPNEIVMLTAVLDSIGEPEIVTYYYDSCSYYISDTVTYTGVWDSCTYFVDTLTGYYEVDTCYSVPYAYTYFEYAVDTCIETSYSYEWSEYYYSYTYDTLPGYALGFIADTDMDGWATGDPGGYWGDYSLPGSPEEGFGVEVGGESFYNSSQYCYDNDIPGTFTSYDDAGDSVRVVWEGTIDAYELGVKQESIIPDNGMYILTRITLTNNSLTDYSDVFYLRNIDPDQEQPWTYNFVTDNQVISNFPADTQAIVTADGTTYDDAFLGMGSRNPNARVSYGAFFTTAANPVSTAWNGTSPFNLSGSETADIAIQVSFKESIPAGTSVIFAYVYYMGESSMEDAMAATKVVPPAPAEDCYEVVDLDASSITETAAEVSWTTSTAATYSFQYRMAGETSWSTLESAISPVSLAGLEPCSNYEYRLVTVCSEVTYETSAAAFATECVAVAINNTNNESFNVSMFPNPTQNNLVVTVNSIYNQDATITITDIVGKIVFENGYSTSGTIELNLSNIESGIYTIAVQQNEFKSTEQLIISK